MERPSDVLKVGQEITARVVDFNGEDRKISLSMKALETQESQEEEHFEYKSSGEAFTGLGDLLKNLKF